MNPLMHRGQELAQFIDHTLLRPEATNTDYLRLFNEAKDYRFFSVCIPPAVVLDAKSQLRGSLVKVCTVVGFPFGYTATPVKAYETKTAIDQGADEIDMVIAIREIKSNNPDAAEKDIQSVVLAANGRPVKVILETSLLSNEEKILACRISQNAGAKFVKTSTGFSSGGATIADIKLMRETCGEKMLIKASGGVRDTATALALLEAGASRLGTSQSIAIVRGDSSAKSDSY